MIRVLIFILALAGMTMPARAFDYDFAVDGDLSSDRLNPTDIALGYGDNHLRGWVQRTHPDYFTIDVPAGQFLTKMWFEEFTSTNARGFVGFQAGEIFTVSLNDASPDVMLGAAHFGEQAFGFEPAGSDLLVDLQSFPDVMGFTRPLPAGHYTFWVNQTEPASIFYQFNFVVAPEPASAGLLAVGGLLLCRLRR